jgi:biopolymer transport protein ExbB/TolQ
MKNSILLWIQNHSKQIKIALGIIATILIIVYGIARIMNQLHNWNYSDKQATGQKEANQYEANANQHETNANILANKQKELADNENKIIQEQQNQQKILSNDEQQTSNTRENLNRALNESLPDRSDNSGTDDEQLRADSNRAAEAFNTRRNKGAVKRKFRP